MQAKQSPLVTRILSDKKKGRELSMKCANHSYWEDPFEFEFEGIIYKVGTICI
jgi:hypothetical protein